MIKTEKQMKEVEVSRRFCDFCGVELHWALACSVARCTICKREMCESCVGHEENDGSDYRTVWCESCWGIGVPHLKEIERLEKEIDKQNELWKQEALNKYEEIEG